MKKVIWLVLVLAVLGLLSGCGDAGPEAKYIGTWSNDGLKYGTIVLSKEGQCELKGFRGQTASTTWKMEGNAANSIVFGDGKDIDYKAHLLVGDSTIMIVSTPDKKELYMYKQ